MPPEMYFQKSCGTFINKVLNFKSRVNKKTEIPKDSITVIILLLLKVESATDRPTITGKSGKMHGARMVSTPAIKDIIKRVIRFIKFPPPMLQVSDYRTTSLFDFHLYQPPQKCAGK